MRIKRVRRRGVKEGFRQEEEAEGEGSLDSIHVWHQRGAGEGEYKG